MADELNNITSTNANTAATLATSATNGATTAIAATDNKSNSHTETDPAKNENKQASDFEALIQRAVDRATNKLGNENKNLRKELEELKKANLSEAELKQLELQEKDKELSEREQALKDRENRLIAIKAIKEIGLDDGSDASLALVDFVMGEDETAIKERVKAFDALVKRFVQSKVDKVFKTNGRTPGKSSTETGSTENKNDHIAVRIGKNVAKANDAAKSTLEHYIGGKK